MPVHMVLRNVCLSGNLVQVTSLRKLNCSVVLLFPEISSGCCKMPNSINVTEQAQDKLHRTISQGTEAVNKNVINFPAAMSCR